MIMRGCTLRSIRDLKANFSIDELVYSYYSGELDSSFQCAMFTLLCWCCCGLQLAGGGLAALFGILAIRNREANVVKAYIGLGLGVVEFLFFIIIMIAGLKENV